MNVATIAWRSDAGADLCALEAGRDGFSLRGTAIVVEDSVPYLLWYLVSVGDDWQTRNVVVHIFDRDGERLVHLGAEGGTWAGGRMLDEPHPDLAGCLDVDLAFTPATNTLPIRRLSLEVGDAADVNAAWVRWPQLDVVRVSQRYERLALDRYRFMQEEFSADITVDREGLVVEYADIWRALGRA